MPDDIGNMHVEKIEFLNTSLAEKGYQLVFEDERLTLQSSQHNFKPLAIDFTAGQARHRRLYGGGKNQPIARALGLKPGYSPVVYDLTAGLGRDAFVMATLGCQVSLIERSPVIALLLQHGLKQASTFDETQAIVQRMRLIKADSREFLKNLSFEDHPDVIYLDPMYPHRDKSALVKKEMRIFRDLVGNDPDAVDLFQIAATKASRRLVVKRPKGADFLGGETPAFQVMSKNTRYDCYLPLEKSSQKPI